MLKEMDPLQPSRGRFAQSVRLLMLWMVMSSGLGWEPTVQAQPDWRVPDLRVFEGAAEVQPQLALRTPKPVLEQETGHSLFWHDDSGAGYRVDGSLFHDSVQPVWYATGESVALFRHENDHEFQTAVSGSQLGVSSDDLDSEFENRGQIILGRSIGDWYRVEGSWLGDYGWSDNFAAQSNIRFVSLGFASSLRDGELNLRRRVRILQWPDYYGVMEFSTLIGFRHLNADEAFNYAAQSNNDDQSASVSVDNEMYGAQIGTQAQILFEDRGWIDIEFKGGIMANSIDVAATYDDFFAGAQAFAGSEERTAFVVDLSLMFNYQFNRAWTARVGYNFLLIDGVALGTRNLSSDATLPLLDVDHAGQTIYHGPSLGIVYAPLPIARREVCPP